MPEVRYYTVTQEREVKVMANSAIDAARIADAAFNGQTEPVHHERLGILPDIWGHPTTPVRVRDIVTREDY